MVNKRETIVNKELQPKVEVAILIAAYNGRKFIKEQINSIIKQSFSSWKLIIRDDGSIDGTKEILDAFSRNDNRIEVVRCDKGNLGACLNFSELIGCAAGTTGYKYFLFCDQDDVWLENKIETQLAAIKKIEEEHGCDVPILIYGTYFFIDEEGERIALPPPDYSTQPSYRYLISQNYLYGCTMLINNKLVEYICNIPNTAENHDYWIALVALAVEARIKYIAEPLLLYRQHSNNISSNIYQSNFSVRLNRFFLYDELRHIKRRREMLGVFIEKFQHILSVRDMNLISGYLESLTNGGVNSFLYCLQHRVRRRFIMQTIVFYLNLLRLKKT